MKHNFMVFCTALCCIVGPMWLGGVLCHVLGV